MPTVTQIRDAEHSRQKKNLTEAQKKNADATKEGFLVNTLIKEPKTVDMRDVYDSMVISENAQMPEKIYETETKQNGKDLLPISAVAVGVMGIMALASIFIRKNSKSALKLDPTHKLPSLTRNLAMNEETHQAIYQMVQTPNRKTALAGVGILTISSMAFMGKMFMDGFKDIWVKRREADIQKNLQEKLIAVETQSFSGKIQIIRSMLADKAGEFSDYLTSNSTAPITFKKVMGNGNIPFSGVVEVDYEKKEIEKKNNMRYFMMGIATLGAIVGLGFFAMFNLRKSKNYLEKYVEASKNTITDIVKNSNGQNKEVDKINLKKMLQAIDADPNYIKTELSKLPWEKGEKDSFIEQVAFDTKKSTAQAERALGGDGTPKPAFYSHVNDYRAFLYNWLLDTSNPLFRNLFFGITGVTALSYGGKVLGEAVKDVQVKKINAQTELSLQQRLVATELRNFKAKKDSAIDPLCDEFYIQLQKGKPKEDLKIIAENILFEVKNGPPFVYS